jgi:hypothetical protein
LFATCRAVVGTNPWKKPRMPFSLAITADLWMKPRILGCARFRSSINCVLMLSKGVTANKDSLKPVPKPASSVLGPVSFPSSSASRFLKPSNATKPETCQRGQSPIRNAGRCTYAGLQSIPNNQSRTAGIPFS